MVYWDAIASNWLLGRYINASQAQNVKHNNTVELIPKKENRFIISLDLNLPQVR